MSDRKLDALDIRNRFKDHQILTDNENSGIRYIVFGTPGTSIYKINYLITKNVLCVFGDCYEAVYMWGQNVSLEFLAGCSLDYFSEKCRASQNGAGAKNWDGIHAKKNIDFHLEDCDEMQRAHFTGNGGYAALGNQFEWSLWLSNHGDEAFGSDWWEMCNIGMNVSFECHAHLIGLKMVQEILTAAQAA